MSFQVIDDNLLAQVRSQAQSRSRRRQNFNLHADYQEPCQRLLNAVEPESYIRPHRHSNPPKDECFIALRGRFLALVFSEKGEISHVFQLGTDQPCLGIDLKSGTWHSIISLEPGGVFFEAKPGPYEPLADKDFASWAPAEESAEAEKYLRDVRQRAFQVLTSGRGE